MKRARNMPNGFSLLEIIVSTAIVGIVLVAIGEAMSTMQNTWVRVRGKADMFRPLRTAADTMNRRLALATLESRWVTEEDAADGKPTGEMVRESDLHFVSGPALKLTGSGATLAGHAIFFQAPFGVDAQRRSESAANSYDRLGHLLNAWGYFVEYGPEPGPRPAFMNQSTSGRRDERRRFRLMEYRQPTEELSLLTAGHERRLTAFQADHKAASALLAQGESPRDGSFDVAQWAAMTTTANVLLNLDEFVTRE